MNDSENSTLRIIEKDVKTVLSTISAHTQWMEDHVLETQKQDNRLGAYSGRIRKLETWRSLLIGMIIGIPSLGVLLFFILRSILEN